MSPGGKAEGGELMQVKTRVKASVVNGNYTDSLVRVQKPTKGLKVKTRIKAGRLLNFPPVLTG
jgi:hypothetical protein